MKKFLSMLLVLCMVVTTLMGVMVVDVSAATSIKLDEATRTFTVTLDDKNVNSSSTGTYVLKPQTPVGDQTTYPLGTVNTETLYGNWGYKLNLNSMTYKDAAATSTVNARYLRLRADVKEPTSGDLNSKKTNFNLGAEIANSLTATEFNTALGNSNKKVLHYSFYAYSSEGAQDYTVQFNCDGSNMISNVLKATDLLSEDGIPHKVDIYVWSSSKDDIIISNDSTARKAKEYLYMMTLVDGSIKSATGNSANEYSENSSGKENTNSGLIKDPTAEKSVIKVNLFMLFNPIKNTVATTGYTFKGGEWFVSAGDTLEFLTREEADDELFGTFEWKNSFANTTFTAKSAGFITGMDTKVASDLETSLTSTTAGTKKLSLYTAYYTKPSNLFTDYASSNVKIVNKDGEELDADAVSALTTLDNYLLEINGVYVVPVEMKEGTTELYSLDYDTATNTATVKYVECKDTPMSFVIVVSATDDKGRTIATKVSAENSISGNSDSIGTKTFSPTFEGLDTKKVKTYKLFVFDSLTSAKPMMVNKAVPNPDYVETTTNE